jgi:hypothetical protein
LIAPSPDVQCRVVAIPDQPRSSDALAGLTLPISREAMAAVAQRSLAAHRRAFALTDAERDRLRRPRASRGRKKAA